MISWSTVVKIDQRQRNRVDKGILTVLMGGKEGNAGGGGGWFSILAVTQRLRVSTNDDFIIVY